MISLIALITAMCGFLNEMNFAQTLTATMGGTVLRYQTTFGIFTFSLGAGAWLFDRCHSHWSARTLLLSAQFAMAALSIGSPLWIRFFNPLFHHQWNLIFTILCYTPVVLAGLISGLELPALLHLVKHNSSARFSPLAWDYVGMFIASAMFPLLFLYTLGVFGVSVLTMCLSLLAAILVGLAVPTTITVPSNKKPTSSPAFFLLLCVFVLSFCSFSYELLLAKILGDLLHDETLAYSLGIGFMLIGLGLGTFLAQRTLRPLRKLIFIEVLLIAMGSLLYALFYGGGAFLYAYPPLEFLTTNKWWALVAFSPLPIAVGILTGYELPLCLKLIAEQSYSEKDVTATAIGLNYLGALGAGLIVPLLLLPAVGTSHSLHILACLNMGVLTLFLFQYSNLSQILRLSASLAAGLAILIGVRSDRWAEQLFLKTYYYDLHMTEFSAKAFKHFGQMTQSIPPIQREITAYQFIDKIKNNQPHSYFAREGFTLYLNKQQQLDSRHWRAYHDSLVTGAANLNKGTAQNILVCGGGDGLLARVLLEDKAVEHITLVELDSRMLELARTDADLLAINLNALEDPKVNITIGDAYSYLFRTQETFDAIYMDFPYPDTFELSRLYSLEMYQAAKMRLRPGGFLVFDAPLWRFVDREITQPPIEWLILKDTLEAAGFASIFAFGPHEPFVFAKVETTELKFDYSAVPSALANASYSNLASLRFLNELTDENQKRRVNSIYQPQPFLKQ